MKKYYIYTKVTTPFALGRTYRLEKTEISEFERIDIGKGYFGLIVKNSSKKLYHCVLEDCSAIIGTYKSRAKLIAIIRENVESGSSKTMRQQIIQGKIDCKEATFIEPEEFFSKFWVDF